VSVSVKWPNRCMAPCPWAVTRALCLFFFVPARNKRYRGTPMSVFHLKSARSTPGGFRMKAPPTRNTPPRCRPQELTPKTIPTWQTTEAQPRKAAFGPSAANGLHNTKKSCAHIPMSAASILTSRPPQNNGSCAGQPGDFPLSDSCGSEPNKRQLAKTKSPTKGRQPQNFSLWAQ